MTGLDFSGPAVAAARESWPPRPAPMPPFVQADVYDAAGGARTRVVRPGLHRHRCAVLAPERLPLGPRWSPRCCGPAGGCSSARDIRCSAPSTTPAPTACSRSGTPYFEQAEPQVFDRGRHLRGLGRGVRAQRHPRVEPRHRPDRHRAARCRDDAHRPGRARQRSLERAARHDDRGRRRVAAGRGPGPRRVLLHHPGVQA